MCGLPVFHYRSKVHGGLPTTASKPLLRMSGRRAHRSGKVSRSPISSGGRFMSAKLIEHGDNLAERREIPITKDEFLIGRGPDCDLRLGVADISRHHCLVRVRGSEAVILDLGSINGTYLNG